jgi:hypothetical protein
MGENAEQLRDGLMSFESRRANAGTPGGTPIN